jgi:2-desacetyl-2-hydroxyethyl bacteriochlorophyllide A dehydrogenase
MEAVETVAHGGPEVLEFRTDVSTPRLDAGQALVRVTAAAVNNTDIWSREGRYGSAEDPDAVAGWQGVPLNFPLIQGIDVAGVVVAVNTDDDNWVGRRVIVDPAVAYRGGLPTRFIGSEVNGGFAQFIACSVDQLHDVTPSPLTDDQLACLPTAYGTALGMLNRAGCAPGERVLVTGSSGGVGMAAIQLLLARGCEVVALTSPSKVDLVIATGASEISVRGRDRLTDLAEVDAVVDVVGGDEFGEVLNRLRDGGRLVTAGAIAGPVVALDLRRLYLRQRTLIGSTMHTPVDFADLAEIARNGAVHPLVAHTYPLDRIVAAQRRFVEKDFVGKLVLDPWVRSPGPS